MYNILVVDDDKEIVGAIQVDIKVDGLSYKIIKEAFERTRKARKYILEEVMLKQLDKPRAEISEYARKIINMKIKVDKIKDVIGTGGKTINKIIDETGVKIDIKEDGQVFIYSEDEKQAKRAKEIIEEIVREIEVGQVYEGTVIKLMNFGAFVDLGAGKEGLVHISKISNDRIKNIEDVLHEGDRVKVKVIEIDDQDRINLSMKDVDESKEK